MAIAVAGNIDGDEPGMTLAQRRRSEAGAFRRTRREVLDEDVGLAKDAVEQGGVYRLLDVGDEALLAPIQPNELAREPLDRRIVAAREIALGALDLDDPGTGVCEPRGAVGRSDRLFERDHQQAGERLGRVTRYRADRIRRAH